MVSRGLFAGFTLPYTPFRTLCRFCHHNSLQSSFGVYTSVFRGVIILGCRTPPGDFCNKIIGKMLYFRLLNVVFLQCVFLLGDCLQHSPVQSIRCPHSTVVSILLDVHFDDRDLGKGFGICFTQPSVTRMYFSKEFFPGFFLFFMNFFFLVSP